MLPNAVPSRSELLNALHLLDYLAKREATTAAPLSQVLTSFPSFPAWALATYSVQQPRRFRNCDDDMSPQPPPAKRIHIAEDYDNNNNSTAAKFLHEFSETYKVKTLKFLSLGDFNMPLDEIQYFGSSQPIPNNVRVQFSMFMERWETSIEYVKTAAEHVRLRFEVKSLHTGQVTSRVETSEDAARRRHKRVTIICNKVFEEAWRKLQGNNFAKCSTKESGTLFGLKDTRMKAHVLEWYATQQQQQQ